MILSRTPSKVKAPMNKYFDSDEEDCSPSKSSDKKHNDSVVS